MTAANVPDVARNGSTAPLQRGSLGRESRRMQVHTKTGYTLVMRVYKKGLSPISPFSDWLLLTQSHRPQGESKQAETKQGGLPTSMLQKVVSSNNDAMNILYEAALPEEGQPVVNERSAAKSASCIPRSLNETDALRIWNACRFVKMGWFSSHEAITLVDLLVYR